MLEINPSLKLCLKLEHTLQLYKAHRAQQRCCTKLFPTCFIKPINHSGPSGDIELYWTQAVRLKTRGVYKCAKVLAYFHFEKSIKSFQIHVKTLAQTHKY